MKRPSAARSKSTTVARQRALIRKLIEQTGWAETNARSIGAATTQTVPVESVSNVIPFPIARRG